MLSPAGAQAGICNWGGGTGLWSDVINWSCGNQPGSSDNANITAPSSIVALNNLNADAATIKLSGGNALNLNNTFLTIHNNLIDNSGTVTLANNSQLRSGSGTVTISGPGTVVLDNSTGYARVGDGGGGFIFGSGQTLRGSGDLGVNQAVLTNNGLISADVATRGIDVDAAGGNGGVGAGTGVGTGTVAGMYNSGTMQATGGGTLSIEGGLYENSVSGVIQALAGSIVSLNGDARIVGGTLKSVGTGAINASNTTQYLNSVALASGSKLNVNNDFLYLNTALTNNGTITVSNNSQLHSEAATLAIGGTGTIILDNAAGYAHIGDGGGTWTLGAGQTVRGSGQIGVNQAAFTNNGVIAADVSGGTMEIDAAGGNGGITGGLGADGTAAFLNNHMIRATGGGTLVFAGGQYDNRPGTIAATTGSVIVLGADARIVGGTISADATSVINAHDTAQYLNSVTLTSGSKLDINNDFVYLNTGLTNNGTVTLANNSQLHSEGATLAIDGTGTIVLDNATGYAHIGAGGGTWTLGVGQTVRGSGQIGVNQAAFTNNGVIAADVSGGTIEIDAAGGNGGIASGLGADGTAAFLNNHMIRATGGGTIVFAGGQYDNRPGTIAATTGSVIVLGADARIVGGTISADATSVINAHDTVQYLNSVTLTSGSKLDINNDFVYLNTALINNGTVTLANNSQLHSEGGTLAIDGTGMIVLDNATGYAQLGDGGGLWTLGSGQVVRGSGRIGVNQAAFTNNSLISADIATGGIDVDAAGGSGGNAGTGVGTGGNAGFYNAATMQAKNGATLSFEGGLYENAAAGLIQALAGSVVSLNGDSRIVGGTIKSVGTGVINAHDTVQYLNSVTLASGSKLDVSNDFLYLNTTLTNDGTVTVRNNSQLHSETGTLAIGGTGTIVLDNSTGYAHLGDGAGTWTLGAGQTVRGSGQVGLNQAVFVNNGVISADVATGTIDIDVAGGSGGLGGGGVGSGGNAGFYNAGTVQASGGGTVALEGGLYENSVTGTFKAVGAGSTFTMNGDASIANLQAGGVLDKGSYISSTTDAASVVNLRSNAADAIAVIGGNTGPTDTVVTLDGVNSTLNVVGFNNGVATSIDASLTKVAASGQLNVSGGRVLNVVAGGGAFTNDGVVELNGGTVGATSYTNTGVTRGNGAVTVAMTNSGTVTAVGGTLATRAINGPGSIGSTTGATLDLSGASANSTAGTLTNGGNLALGTHNVTVTSNYTNASFGSGNAFDNHANVSGSGLILAASATMDLSGPGLSGNTLNVGSVRTGGSSSTSLTITNNGASTNLIGAVQNGNAPSVALSASDFTAAYGGGTAVIGVSYTGIHAGSLAGQTINVINNFDNVANKTLDLQGNVYQVAQVGALPASVALGARRVGDAAAISTLTIANTAPVTAGFNEKLATTASVGGGFKLDGGGTVNVPGVAAGSTAQVTLSHGTATAGSFTSTVAVGNTSLAVAGSGLSDLALAGQSVAVSSNVYAAAIAQVGSTSVNFGTVRQNGTAALVLVSLGNGATGALTDTLVTTLGGLPGNVSAAAPAPLAAGASTNIAFALDTSTAGIVGGSGTLGFVSHDSELADLALGSQSVAFSGTVTQLAQAALFKNAGLGAFAGTGATYTLNLGSLASGSGSYTTDLGVANTNGGLAYSELLGGAFNFTGSNGFGFTGASFAGLQGGMSLTGDILNFNTTGLAAGTYSHSITLNAYSQYADLSNYLLGPITVNISAMVTGAGGTGAVPEPAAWAMMIVGFGAIGGSMRRRRSGALLQGEAS
ncbi:MAG: choice-of-anchor D domain-containing protein [Janthinobacterium lividum]